MKLVACNKCGVTIQDDPLQALGAIHNNAGDDSSNCGGQFVEMSEAEAETLAASNVSDVTFGTEEK